MRNLTIDLQAIGKEAETPSALPAPISKPASPQPNPQRQRAATAADRLFDLLPPQDVGDPQAFLAATIALFARYPAQVQDRAAFEIPLRSDRPTLRIMKLVLDELNEPYERETERMLAERSHRLSLPPPRAQRTPEEQARIDEKIDRWRARMPPVPRKGWFPPMKPGDGKHGLRVEAELAARRAAKEARQQQQGGAA